MMIDGGSFRDKSGFVFQCENTLYRYIDDTYKHDYAFLKDTGLYDKLVEKELLVPHEEASLPDKVFLKPPFKIIKPEKVPFITYPYEWCFSQLKSAAILTLQIQNLAFEYGMSLKDASAYNVQFIQNKPVFIDTLSFERRQRPEPWGAYKQFCQHFLAPLALMARTDVRLSHLFTSFLDGIPLDLASKLLPRQSFLSPGLLFHIHLHSKHQKKYEKKHIKPKPYKDLSFKALIDSLQTIIERQNLPAFSSEWSDYYDDIHYSKESLESKIEIVDSFMDEAKPDSVWDVGMNTGFFSARCARRGIQTIGFDSDPICIEKRFKAMNSEDESSIFLPIVMDFTNPSSGIGWENQERMSLQQRGSADLILALAVIHHIVLSNNIPLDYVARFFSKLAKELIVEFIPAEDKMALSLTKNRKELPHEYSINAFRTKFNLYFQIVKEKKIEGSERVLFYMRLKNG